MSRGQEKISFRGLVQARYDDSFGERAVEIGKRPFGRVSHDIGSIPAPEAFLSIRSRINTSISENGNQPFRFARKKCLAGQVLDMGGIVIGAIA
jgi:hypothetical protein